MIMCEKKPIPDPMLCSPSRVNVHTGSQKLHGIWFWFRVLKRTPADDVPTPATITNRPHLSSIIVNSRPPRAEIHPHQAIPKASHSFALMSFEQIDERHSRQVPHGRRERRRIPDWRPLFHRGAVDPDHPYHFGTEPASLGRSYAQQAANIRATKLRRGVACGLV